MIFCCSSHQGGKRRGHAAGNHGKCACCKPLGKVCAKFCRLSPLTQCLIIGGSLHTCTCLSLSSPVYQVSCLALYVYTCIYNCTVLLSPAAVALFIVTGLLLIGGASLSELLNHSLQLLYYPGAYEPLRAVKECSLNSQYHCGCCQTIIVWFCAMFDAPSPPSATYMHPLYPYSQAVPHCV